MQESEQSRSTVCVKEQYRMLPNIPVLTDPACLGGKPTGDGMEAVTLGFMALFN